MKRPYANVTLTLAALCFLCAALSGCGSSESKNKSDDLSPKALYERSQILQERGRFDEAIEALDAAIEQEPANPQLYAQRGIANEGAGRLDAAIADYTASLEQDESYILALNNRAAIYGRTQQFEKAYADLKESASMASNQPLVQRNLGTVLLDLDRAAEAVEPLRIAVVLDPNDAIAARQYGRALALAGEPEAAISAFDKAVTLDDAAAASHLELGRLRYKQKDYAGALQSLRRAAEIEPSDEVDELIALTWEYDAFTRFAAESDEYDPPIFGAAPDRFTILTAPGKSLLAIAVDYSKRPVVNASRWNALAVNGNAAVLFVDGEKRWLKMLDDFDESRVQPETYLVLP